ncbi:MAG: peptide ABC transporter substrate-binding protein [Anaerolineae bacterium]|nr:peptide ABC transporter substrate-binding protein [Anaerolineae bacterium]
MSGRHRLYLVIVLVVIAALVAPVLSPARAQTLKTIKVPNPVGKGDIRTADPALVSDYPSAQIVSEAYYALVRGLETDLNKIQPGMAEKWDVSKDGLTYTFTIRKGIPWVKWDSASKQVVQVKDDKGNVLNVTAHDFEYAVKRVLDPGTAAEYAYIYTTVIKGGAEFNSSKETGDALTKLRDAVGVKATDDNTLVITLPEPAGYAINILTQVHIAAQPQTVIEKQGAKWTEPGNAWSYGPYVISEWKHDDSITLTKNPFWPGIENSPKPQIDQVTMMLSLDQSGTFSNYEAGTMDVSLVPITEIDRVKSDAKLSKELNIAPVLSSAYYGFNAKKAPFDDARVRRAFSLAVDRKAIVENVTKGGEIPARWFSRPGVAAAPTLENSPDLGITFDAGAAKKELQAYLDEKKITVDQLPPITLMSYQSEAVVKTSEAMQQMWTENLGVKVELATQELKVFLDNLNTDAPQVYSLGWSADYPDANNFLREVFRSNSGNNHSGWANAEFDKLVDDAAKETDPAKRTDLYKKAEDILVVKDAVIIPLYWRTRVQVTKPYVERTNSLLNGDERFEKWDIKK